MTIQGGVGLILALLAIAFLPLTGSAQALVAMAAFFVGFLPLSMITGRIAGRPATLYERDVLLEIDQLIRHARRYGWTS